MNILYLCDEYPPCKHGGIGSVTQTLARELVKKNHNVFVNGFYPYFRNALPFENDNGVKVFRNFYGNRLLLQFSRRKFLGSIYNISNSFNHYTSGLTKFIYENDIHIIEIPDFNEAFRYSGTKFIRFPNFQVPVVVKLHGTYNVISQLTQRKINKYIYMKELYLINNATRIIGVSSYTKKIVKETFNYPRPIELIYNGVNIGYVKNNEKRLDNTVIFAGTVCENKGIFSLIKAWSEVVKNNPLAKLFIYGKIGERDLIKVNQLIPKNQKHSIQLKGFISKEELLNQFRLASCSIFPSYIENFSLVPLESMQMGCPTIFTERASGNELISNGHNGLLIDPDNITGISDAILFLLNNKSEAARIGKNGTKTIRDKFDISIIADQHIKLYSSLIK